MKRFHSFYLLAGILLVGFPSQGHAEETELQAVTDYIRVGLNNSASLKSAFEAYTSVSLQGPQVTALPDPKLSYGYFIQSVETRVGPQRQTTLVELMGSYVTVRVINVGRAGIDQRTAVACERKLFVVAEPA